MALAVKTDRVWQRLLVWGVALQIVGVVIAWTTYWRNNSYGDDVGSNFGLTVAAVIGFVGFWIMVVGIIAAGILVALHNVSEDGVPIRSAPGGLRHIAPTEADLARVASDPTPFDAHPGDSATVAEVRRALSFGSSRSAVRGLVRKEAREGRLDKTDHGMIEALIAESERRQQGSQP